MDIYLPADFRTLHDAAAEDWRDASTTSATRDRAQSDEANLPMVDPNNRCADPTWIVI
jgi:hypothetical protein